MKKLRLDVEKLGVESFEPGARTDGNGAAYDDNTCSKHPTCGVASRGQETYDFFPITRYACCV